MATIAGVLVDISKPLFGFRDSGKEYDDERTRSGTNESPSYMSRLDGYNSYANPGNPLDQTY